MFKKYNIVLYPSLYIWHLYLDFHFEGLTSMGQYLFLKH